MTATYERNDLEFLYPENWSIAENEMDDFVEIALESPDGVIWSVSIFLDDADNSSLIESCAAALTEQYEDFEMVPFDGELGGFRATGFDADFYCLDFLITAAVRAFVTADKTLLVFSQAESREFDKNRDVLDAITLSLLKSTANSS